MQYLHRGREEPSCYLVWPSVLLDVFIRLVAAAQLGARMSRLQVRHLKRQNYPGVHKKQQFGRRVSIHESFFTHYFTTLLEF